MRNDLTMDELNEFEKLQDMVIECNAFGNTVPDEAYERYQYLLNLYNRNISSISELIERLKKTESFSGYCSALINKWFCEYKRGEDFSDNYYYELSGALWMLTAMNVITDGERDVLIENLIYLVGSDSYYYDCNGNEFWIDDDGKRHYTRDEG